MKPARRRYWWLRCYECGGIIRKIGHVPPETYECGVCGNLFRMTKRNKIKCWNAWKKKRRETQQSRDKYPRHIKPNLKKIRGER